MVNGGFATWGEGCPMLLYVILEKNGPETWSQQVVVFQKTWWHGPNHGEIQPRTIQGWSPASPSGSNSPRTVRMPRVIWTKAHRLKGFHPGFHPPLGFQGGISGLAMGISGCLGCFFQHLLVKFWTRFAARSWSGCCAIRNCSLISNVQIAQYQNFYKIVTYCVASWSKSAILGVHLKPYSGQ